MPGQTRRPRKRRLTRNDGQNLRRHMIRRMRELGLTRNDEEAADRDQLAERANVDRSTVYNLMRPNFEKKYVPDSARAVEAALYWEHAIGEEAGSIERCLNGEDPIELQIPRRGRKRAAG